MDAVKAYADIVYRTALSATKAPQDAEDVTQTVFMKLLEAKDSFTDEEHLRRWLIRVTVNECKNLWKSFWRRSVGLFGCTDEDVQEPYDFKGHTERGRRRGMPPKVPEFEELSQSALYEAVMALPKDYRIVIHLFYYEDYRTGEIAELLHIREQTVRTRLVRARNKLKQRLEEAWQDEE
ncbi:MAG: sigma-70 family RNA polymerase sigma factor [Lachnospiraceae bacterium]|nr:sigma-70 family RNA polymerase sigma factor [Lachnospiraceae bacterium]